MEQALIWMVVQNILNVGLIINQKPVAGVIYAPKKKRMFYAYGKKKAYEIYNKSKKKN